MSAKKKIVEEYASMWSREVFDIKEKGKKGKKGKLMLSKLSEAKGKTSWLNKKGVYILYRDDHPYYIGKAERSLYSRLHDHANKAPDRYYNFWNYFSAFVVNKDYIPTVEAILIAAMPTTVNSSAPKIGQAKKVPEEIRNRMREARQSKFDSPCN